LSREGLLKGIHAVGEHPNRHFGPTTQFNLRDNESSTRYKAPEDGLIVSTTPYGVELFLWGCGLDSQTWLELHFLTEDQVTFEPPIPPSYGIEARRLPKATGPPDPLI
jgi:hypothetical protein